ncbi:MAG: M23 family metallopeptidase [bacterium]
MILITVAALVVWVSTSIFKYSTHKEKPIISVLGLKDNDGYKGIMQCTLSASNSYKIYHVSVLLDGKEFDFGSCPYVKSKSFNIPFSIDTTTLEYGKHTLEVRSVDSSYNQNRSHDIYEFYVDNIPLKASFLQTKYTVDQGKTLHVKIQTNKKLNKTSLAFLSKTYECYPESLTSNIYECFIPIDCEAQHGESLLTAELEDIVHNNVKLSTQAEIAAFNFTKQKTYLNISTKKLDEEKDISMNSKILQTAIEKWAESSSKQKMWAGPFELPTQTQRIATPHGEIRVTPERGRYMHKGIDLVNHPRTVVWASQTGKVIIKDRYLLTGNTVVLDHGLGVSTLYAHLNDFANIEVGDIVKKGNPVGRIGMTGYATGYHLHWELLVNGVSVEPLEWTKKIF